MKQSCMSCNVEHEREELHWVNDIYGIAYMKVCDKCFDKVQDQVLHDNLEGEDDNDDC